MRGPANRIVNPFDRQGEIKRRADKNWLLTSPFKRAAWPVKADDKTFTGSCPSLTQYSISAPNSFNPSTKSRIGLSFKRELPPIVFAPGTMHNKANIKRTVVPESRAYKL